MKTFRDFMESALYHPETGYYTRRRVKQDFYTAPELHPAFGGTLAVEVGRWLKQLGPGSSLVEAGSGNGTLFAAVLDGLKAKSPEILENLSCTIIERSARFLTEALKSMAPLSPCLQGFPDLARVPPFRGVLFTNELFDALPVHILEKRDGTMQEVFVQEEADGPLTRLEPLSDPALEPFARRAAGNLQEGGRTAVPLDALRWLRLAAGKLQAGTLITIDFGKRFGGHPFVPKTFYRHVLGSDPLQDPGERDITTPVDFDLLIEEGEKLGLKTESFQPMGRFLLDRGILDHLPKGDDLASYKERNQIKALFHPDGMGESFKVLVQSR